MDGPLGNNLALEESQRAHDPKRFMPKLSCKERGSRAGFLKAYQNAKLLKPDFSFTLSSWHAV